MQRAADGSPTTGCNLFPSMHHVARQLVAEEIRSDPLPAARGRAAFRVCEKLRRPICTCAGSTGFRSLLRRALSLAQVEAPSLAGLQVDEEGAFIFPADLENQLETETGAIAGESLVRQLLELLVTFIGKALTLRLIHEVWPKAAPGELNPLEEKP